MITLTDEEKEFIEKAKNARVVSLGVGGLLTASVPRVEIPGVMVINYKDQERATMIWKLAVEQKRWEEEGDF